MTTMNITNIKSASAPLFASAWEIYQYSFPASERRRPEAQRKALEEQPECSMDIYTRDDDPHKVIGFMLHWDFGHSVYLEHFAVSRNERNNGAGGRMLDSFIERNASKRIILDIDMPVDDISKRRLGFYQRHGLVDNPTRKHIHPNLSDPCAESFELLLMSYGNTLDDEEFRRFRDDFENKICLNL